MTIKPPTNLQQSGEPLPEIELLEAGDHCSVSEIKSYAKTMSNPESGLRISYAQALQAIAVGIGYTSYEDALKTASIGVERYVKMATRLDKDVMLAKAQELSERSTTSNARITNANRLIKVKNQIFNAVRKVSDLSNTKVEEHVYDDSYALLLYPCTADGAMGSYTTKIEDFYFDKRVKESPEGLSNVDSRIHSAIHEINFVDNETPMGSYECMELFFCASLPLCGHVVVLASNTDAADKEYWTVSKYAYVLEISLGNVTKARLIDLCTMNTEHSIVITEVGK